MAKMELLAGYNVPNVSITKTAATWVREIVAQHETEVGFYGTVRDEGEGNFTIVDVFYPKHELVTGGTCEISPEGMTEVMEYLLDKGRDDEIGMLKMWGHSHVKMAVSPSGQDESMGLELATDNGDFLIRMITNKNGAMGITFYDMVNKVRFLDLPLTELDNEDGADEVVDILDGILTDGGIDPVDKLNEILDVVDEWKNSSNDVAEISEKVKAMKTTNIPAPKVYQGRNNSWGANKVWNSRTRQYESPAQELPKKVTDFGPKLTEPAPDIPLADEFDDEFYRGYYM